ncbi:MAG: hypothetical protein LBS00_11425, partial [Synergistaceae bacterium]|nr:hypothetical protein [Synergistaceae bacterium]
MLLGGSDNDSLEGGYGADVLLDGADGDALSGGAGHDLLLGGAGNDTLNPGASDDMILFSAGDGQDHLVASGGGSDTLSLGGGIAYGDFVFSKSGNDLVLDDTDQIIFSGWYSSSSSRTVVTLQMIAEAMDDFDAGGDAPLLDQNVETFDFAGLVNAFDAART